MFSNAALKFLGELATSNRRAWFEENKPRHELLVCDPALDFIEAIWRVCLPWRAIAPIAADQPDSDLDRNAECWSCNGG